MWTQQLHSSPCLCLTLHSASFQSRPESTKDGVMLLGVKSSGGEENGELSSVCFLRSFHAPCVCAFFHHLVKLFLQSRDVHWFQGSYRLLISHCALWAFGAFCWATEGVSCDFTSPPSNWKIATSYHKHRLFWTGAIVRSVNVRADVCVFVGGVNAHARSWVCVIHDLYTLTPPIKKKKKTGH